MNEFVFDYVKDMLAEEVRKAIKGFDKDELEALIKKCSDDNGEPFFRESYSGQPVEEQLTDFVVKHNDNFDNPKIKEVINNFDYAKAGVMAELDLQEIAAGYDEYMQEAEKAKQEYMKEYGVTEETIEYEM